jgi:hypothetical protein
VSFALIGMSKLKITSNQGNQISNMKATLEVLPIANCPGPMFFLCFSLFKKKKKKKKKEHSFRPTHIHCTPGLAGLRPASMHLAQVCRGYVRSDNYQKPYLTTQKSISLLKVKIIWLVTMDKEKGTKGLPDNNSQFVQSFFRRFIPCRFLVVCPTSTVELAVNHNLHIPYRCRLCTYNRQVG